MRETLLLIMPVNRLQNWLSCLVPWLKPTTTDRPNAHQLAERQNTNVAEEEVKYIFNRIQTIPGLWKDLCNATEEGKPQCLRRVNEIARRAGIIESDMTKVLIARETSDLQDGPVEGNKIWNKSKSFIIHSEHHEAVRRIQLSNQDDWYLLTIIWALEGQLFLR